MYISDENPRNIYTITTMHLEEEVILDLTYGLWSKVRFLTAPVDFKNRYKHAGLECMSSWCCQLTEATIGQTFN